MHLSDGVLYQSGYSSREYPASFVDHGKPIFLKAASGWLIKRPVAETGLFDAMGCYPIFCCQDWSGLIYDFKEHANSIVSIAMVTDPFGNYTTDLLESVFGDVVKPYKSHYVVDLSLDPTKYINPHHLRNSKRALQETTVKTATPTPATFSEWCSLYENLIARHKITGMAAFSKKAFSQQMKVPGMTIFRAEHNGEAVGMILWYVQNENAYYHLGAYSDKGYEVRASFALFRTAIDYFTERGLKFLCLGAGAGLSGDVSDGLTRFKQGWATGERTAYFCGRIFDQDAYDQLSRRLAVESSKYFPAYREGEFN